MSEIIDIKQYSFNNFKEETIERINAFFEVFDIFKNYCENLDPIDFKYVLSENIFNRINELKNNLIEKIERVKTEPDNRVTPITIIMKLNNLFAQEMTFLENIDISFYYFVLLYRMALFSSEEFDKILDDPEYKYPSNIVDQLVSPTISFCLDTEAKVILGEDAYCKNSDDIHDLIIFLSKIPGESYDSIYNFFESKIVRYKKTEDNSLDGVNVIDEVRFSCFTPSPNMPNTSNLLTFQYTSEAIMNDISIRFSDNSINTTFDSILNYIVDNCDNGLLSYYRGLERYYLELVTNKDYLQGDKLFLTSFRSFLNLFYKSITDNIFTSVEELWAMARRISIQKFIYYLKKPNVCFLNDESIPINSELDDLVNAIILEEKEKETVFSEEVIKKSFGGRIRSLTLDI